ncbi:hypothetical protein HPP92_027659 [Vanilla planifolia]|uniref:Pentatricopeptide repeat-containing protein n=1 Tax=Vanilla planifolia TaxID=51239 RepID=A0A835PA89_VANPL|nr:hypothetical protein HPP92_027659 [Vanilla planifolia]
MTGQKLQNLRRIHALHITRGDKSPAEWANVVRNYLLHGFTMEAIVVYIKMLPRRTRHRFLPLILKACALHSLLMVGKSLHAESIKAGLVYELLRGTTFVTMYGRCHEPTLARKLFDEMPFKNAATYNSMIGNYFMNGDMVSASTLFHSTPERTPVTWVVMIEGYAAIGNISAARHVFNSTPPWMRTVVTWTAMVHGYAAKGDMDAATELFDEMPLKNAFVWSCMITGYFKIGDAVKARAVFDRIFPAPNLVNWNALIAGYAKLGFYDEAFGGLRRMLGLGIDPDEFTVVSLLSVCAQLGSLDCATELHELIRRKRINMNSFVNNGLVDMYAKCGDLEKARRIFDTMRERNDACWNSMISGLASHGSCHEALKLFSEMEASDVKPNSVTFLAVLSACTHGGFVDKGLEIFQKMGKFSLKAGVEHYGCLVDLLGRAGRVAEAYDVVRTMPMKPNELVWGALLGACRVHSDMEMADQVAHKANYADSTFSSVYDEESVLLSNIYAASEKWAKAERIRRRMEERGGTKTPGCSLIQI